MKIIRIILFISIVLIVFGMFSLPKIVLKNKTNKLSTTAENSDNDFHDNSISKELVTKLESLTKKLSHEESIKKRLTFADSLAQLYYSVDRYDSASKYFEMVVSIEPTIENWKKTGESFYKGFEYALEEDKKSLMGNKAREYYEMVLEKEPDNLEVKNNIAMTLLSTNKPMSGILMLREILENDPNNEKAIFNLGLLSMESNQFRKAIERFSKLIKLSPTNTQVHFLLGLCYIEIGDKERAKSQLELVKSLDNDSSIQVTVNSYLEEL